MRAAVIVPYRDRKDHLDIFIPTIKKYFDAHVYVIEQCDEEGFNLGKLINCAFIEFHKEFDYFVIHDVDTLPVKVDYSYSIYPCHLGTQIEKWSYKLPYPRFFGGVILMPNAHFEIINGYDNGYFFYGAEDDALRKRLEAKLIPIESRECRFKSLPHEENINHEKRMINYQRSKAPIDWNNGLSSCKYEIVHCEDMEHYTLLQVKL
jgi:hypothetical protein